MHFTTKKDVLEGIVSAASRAVNLRSPLPVLTGVHLEAKGDILTATGSDLEVTTISSVPVEVVDEGSIILPSKFFCELVKRLPDGQVSFEVADNSAVIRYGKQKATSAVMPATDYPFIPSEEGKTVEVDTAEFISSVKKTYFACLDEIGRPNLSGVLLNVTPFNIEVAATDTRRANMAFMQAEGEEGRAIVPRRSLEEAIKLFRDPKTQITIGTNLVTLTCGNIKIKTRVIAGKYPDFYSKLPKAITRVKVNSSELLDTLNRASLLVNADGISIIDITVKDNLLTVESIGVSGSVSEQLKVEHEGEPVEMSFIAKYLAETIAVCGNHPTLYFMGKYSPLRVDEENFFSIILPIRKTTKESAA